MRVIHLCRLYTGFQNEILDLSGCGLCTDNNGTSGIPQHEPMFRYKNAYTYKIGEDGG